MQVSAKILFNCKALYQYMASITVRFFAKLSGMYVGIPYIKNNLNKKQKIILIIMFFELNKLQAES